MNSPSTTVRHPRRYSPRNFAYLLAVLLVAGLFASIPSTNANANEASNGIFPDTLAPEVPVDSDRRGVELGVKFSPDASGHVTALQYYQSATANGANKATLWDSNGKSLATVSFEPSSKAGWRTIQLDEPVQLTAGENYVASYYAPKGSYPSIDRDFTSEQSLNGFSVPRNAGVYTYSSSSAFPSSSWRSNNYLVDIVFEAGSSGTEETPDDTPEPEETPTTPEPTTPPTTEQPVTGGFKVLDRSFPNSETTGVPAGTALTPYTGSCTIQTANLSIQNKVINCDLQIRAHGVNISNSIINGTIFTDSSRMNGSFTLTDSEVRAPMNDATGIGSANFVVTRVEVNGGRRSIDCAVNCTVQDSYVHGQYKDLTGQAHESGIRMGSGSTLKNNTIACTAESVGAGGCSAALTGYGDFAVVENNVIDGNLFLADSGGYCAYGGSSPGKPYSNGVNNVKFTNNVWMRGPSGVCGIWGPIVAFDKTAPGNVWSNNVYDNGKVINP